MGKYVATVVITTSLGVYVDVCQKQADQQCKRQTVSEVQQSDGESYENSEDGIYKHINTVNIKSLSFYSIISSTITKLETSSRQKRDKCRHRQ